VADLLEAARWCGPNSLAGGIGALQARKPGLEGVIARAQLIVGRVRDFGRIVLVVQPVVVGDLPRQAFELGCRFLFAERLDWLFRAW
jgi:hypothetical protein